MAKTNLDFPLRPGHEGLGYHPISHEYEPVLQPVSSLHANSPSCMGVSRFSLELGTSYRCWVL